MKYNLFLNYSISIQQLDKFKGWHMYFLQTSLCIDTGIMDSQIYQKILRDSFVTFATDFFPNGYLLYQVILFKVHFNFVLQTSNTNPPVFII